VPEDKNSYRSITKAIGLFGGVRIFQILINVIKLKLIAVLLGPLGMGISGLITSATGIISSLTGFGLETSAVRNVSQAYSSGDDNQIGNTISVLRKLILLTGLLGTLITFILSKYLSIWSFGNTDYTVVFQFISVTLFLDQLCIGRSVLMQGTFHYKFIAKTTIFSNLFSLIVAIPLFYFWGFNGIYVDLITTSTIKLCVSWYYSRQIPIIKIVKTIKESIIEGRGMLSLGIAIALSGVINTGSVYLVRLFISNYGGVSDVGLYTAGFTISNGYVGIILNAMGTDYSPRLSSMANNIKSFNETINHQNLLLCILMAPLIILFIVFIKILILLFYSSSFLAICNMLEWIMFGMILRTISWCMSFSLIALGDSKLFFINELITTSTSVLLSMVGFRYFGFLGIGYAFCITYLLYSIQLYFICRRKFGFRFSLDSYKIMLPLIFLLSSFFVLLQFFRDIPVFRYLIGIIGIIAISSYSYYYLNKMLNLRLVFNGLSKKIFHKS
jgi:O-antigen/teichoic acid export membrane protein